MDSISDLAPVVIFCYNRPKLTKNTLIALQQNNLAKYTNLFIFIDGPKSDQDVDKVNRTIQIIREFKGFNKITLFKNNVNKGLANSVIDGVTKIINQYNKVIVLEDDLITHPKYLNYMNEALTFYEDNNDIWSISGYTPQIKLPSNYNDDLYLTLRGSSWGWATWKDRWDSTIWEWKDEDYEKLFSEKPLLDMIGEDIYYLTKDYKNNLIDSWAIRWTNTQYLLKKFTVFPRYTFVLNEGFGRGSTHGSLNNNFKTILPENEFNINLSELEYNKEIEKKYSELYKLQVHNRIAIMLKKIKIYKFTKKIVKKIR